MSKIYLVNEIVCNYEKNEVHLSCWYEMILQDTFMGTHQGIEEGTICFCLC